MNIERHPERRTFTEAFVRLWQVAHGTAILFAVGAFLFAMFLLDWMTANQGLAKETYTMLLGLVAGNIIGGFVGVASARTTPQPEPAVPEGVVRDLIAAFALPGAKGSLDKIGKSLDSIEGSIDNAKERP